MSNLAFTYALLAGVSLSAYIVGLRLAGPGTHPVLGTAIVTGIAFLINLVATLWIRAGGTPTPVSMKALYFLTLVGVATAGANLFTLLAYANGLRVTSSFIIGAHRRSWLFSLDSFCSRNHSVGPSSSL
jgi:uncharacterized membrane protein